MCGIIGAVSLKQDQFSQDQFKAALECLAHRGPDDQGLWQNQEKTALLGNRRLKIIDLSPAGHQPMETQKTIITYNGEIYNFKTLKNALKAQGIKFYSQTDTEVILKLYETQGLDFAKKLDGMFAIALWDKTRNRLILARDRLGIKPLYYAKVPGSLIFASELKALIKANLIERTLNPSALKTLLSLGSVLEPETIVKGVKMLPPATLLIWEKGILKSKPFWQLGFGKKEYSQQQAVSLLKQKLTQAVSERLISERPLGVFLSAGYDSSTVAYLAQKATRAPIKTLTVSFEAQKDPHALDEAKFAGHLAKTLDTRHQEIQISSHDLKNSFQHFIASYDQPSIDGLNTYLISQAASQAGLTVVLSGLGGDELFGGYKTFKVLVPIYQLLPKNLFNLPLYLRARQIFPKSLVQKLIKIPLPKTKLLPPALPPEAFDKVSQLELNFYLKNQLLRDTDVMSMSHSIELRVPMLDYQLIETVASIPTQLKQGGYKKLLKATIRDWLPPEILERPKQGFVLPFDSWLRGPLKPELDQIFYSELKESRVFQALTAQKIWQKFLKNKLHWSRPWLIAVTHRFLTHHNLT
jgi:asparagine synthase (glutamine-hydrolysing)